MCQNLLPKKKLFFFYLFPRLIVRASRKNCKTDFVEYSKVRNSIIRLKNMVFIIFVELRSWKQSQNERTVNI